MPAVRCALIVGLAGAMLVPCALRAQPAAERPAAAPAPKEAAPTGVSKIRQDAAALRPLVGSDLARAFLDATSLLPAVEPRTLYADPATKAWYSAAQADALPEAARATLKARPFDEQFYYNTKYGSPLAYVRALDLIAQSEADPALTDAAGTRLLDYGYGTVGHLRLLAALGCDATGVDVDPLLQSLYSEASDQGPFPPRGHEADATPAAGSVTLLHGRFPADPEVSEALRDKAGTFDLIVSKNTLKNGYLHPSQPVDKRMLVDLGVEEEAFVRAMHGLLKPGGMVMIYNLSPAPSKEGEPYKPWADGRCPFTREMLEAAGFRVLAFDADDGPAARAMARALGWDAGGMDLENDLFAHYTLVQRAGAR